MEIASVFFFFLKKIPNDQEESSVIIRENKPIFEYYNYILLSRMLHFLSTEVIFQEERLLNRDLGIIF